jgi:RHS repeat-associated protein
VELDGRTVSLDGYRFGYQGSEKDNETKGNGNSYTTEFRQLDPRLGRWLSVDPMFAKFPWQSPYVSFDNNPILLIDHLGTETKGGPVDGYTKNKDGSRSRTNSNGTKTYDAAGGYSITLPNNATILGTHQDNDKDGMIDYNGVKLSASAGDLYKFKANNKVYTASYSKGKFMGYVSSDGGKYKCDVITKTESNSNHNIKSQNEIDYGKIVDGGVAVVSGVLSTTSGVLLCMTEVGAPFGAFEISTGIPTIGFGVSKIIDGFQGGNRELPGGVFEATEVGLGGTGSVGQVCDLVSGGKPKTCLEKSVFIYNTYQQNAFKSLMEATPKNNCNIILNQNQKNDALVRDKTNVIIP